MSEFTNPPPILSADPNDRMWAMFCHLGTLATWFPFANVIHLTDELPQEPAEHPDFWHLWRTALLRVLPAN